VREKVKMGGPVILAVHQEEPRSWEVKRLVVNPIFLLLLFSPNLGHPFLGHAAGWSMLSFLSHLFTTLLLLRI